MKKIVSFFSIIFLGIILVACGGDKKYTVTYDVYGGTPNIAAEEVKANGLATKPSPDPTKAGYTFEYWIEKESKTEWKFAEHKVTKDITLVAKWKENTPVEQKVTITFNIGYEGGTNPASQEIVKGAKASEPTGISREGYTLLGWYKGNDKFNFTTAINENITLTAKWELNVPAEEKVTVTFNINYEGGVNPPAQEIKKGTTVTEPTGISRDGYIFLGWYKDDVKFVFTTVINEDITLTAKWEEINLEPQFTTDLFISEYIEGSSFNKAIEIYNGTGAEVNLQNYRLVMYNFSGSAEKDAPSGTYSAVLEGTLGHNEVFVMANTKIDASVQGKVNVFNDTVINFNGNDPIYLEKLIDGVWVEIDAFGLYVEGQGTTGFALDNTYVRKDTVTGPANTWNKNDWNILEVDTFTELGSHEYSLLPPITSYTVSFDSKGGSAVEPQTVNEGKKATLPTPAPVLDGYIFVGWYLGEAAYDFATPITEDITLVAKWELITVADVSNEAELKAALENENIREINLLNNITLENKLVLSRNDVTINGNEHKLSLVSPEGWQGAYILQAYKVTGATITNLVFEGGDAGLLVNGSEVTIENITLNDHEFGGIEVSQGAGVETTPKLTVIGQIDSNLLRVPYIWIDKAIINDGWVILPAELALGEVVYTEAGKEQVWFIDQTAPVLLEKTLEITDGKLVLVIKAQDDNLYSLEVDHSLNNNEFTVYASEEDPYGGQEDAFEALDVVVVFADGTWTITFGNRAMDLIKSVTQLNEFKVHVVIKDHVGNAFGSMSPTTEENTVSIHIYNLDLVEDETTTNTIRLFAGELVVLPVLEDKGGLQFAGWFTDEELTNEYIEAAIKENITLTAKWELITVANVSSEAELKAALENENIREINLLNNITLENKLVLSRNDVTINGNGHKLSLESPEEWQGAYILQAYKVTGVTITNLVFEGGDAALYVNGSEVTIENITLNDHEFGGIEVSQGVGVETTPKLTVNGQLDSNLLGFPYIWIDKATANNGWVILPTELALGEVVYTEEGKEQVWFIDQTVDETDPVLLEKTLQIIDGKLVLVIKAQDDNLYSLEVDHSLNNNEFTVYASEQDPYGGQEDAFEALDVVVVFADGTWTITFGNGAMDLIKSVTQLNEFKVHVVIKDRAGNAFGSMSPTTEENTVSINIYNLDLVEDETTTKTERLFAGELVALPVLEDKDELLFVGWFTDEELTNEYIEAAIESHLTLYAKFEEETVEETLTAKLTYGTTKYTNSASPNNKNDFQGEKVLVGPNVTSDKAYWASGHAMRLSSGSALGHIVYEFHSSILVHKVIIVLKLYNDKTNPTIKVNDILVEENLTLEASSHTIELLELTNIIKIESVQRGGSERRVLIESVEIVYTKN